MGHHLIRHLTDRRWITPVTLIAVCVLAAAPLPAQDIVTNSNLAGGLAPWVPHASAAPDPPATGSVTWTNTHNDDNVADGTGSAWVQLDGQTAQPANASVGIRQCVVLPAEPTYLTSASYSAHFLAPATGNPTDGLADVAVEVRFHSDSSCSAFIPGAGGSQGYRLTAAALSDTVWHEIGDPGLTMPNSSVAASSVEVRAFVRIAGPTDNPYQVYFDRIRLSLNLAPLIFVDDFESGNANAWSAVMP